MPPAGAARRPVKAATSRARPDHRQRVAAVRLDVHVQHHLAHDRAQRRAERQLVAAPPRMWIPSASSPSPSSIAEQSIPCDSTPRIFDALDATVAGQHRADHAPPAPGRRPRCCRRRTRSAAAPPAADIHARQPQLVRVRMPLDAEQPPDHDIGPVRAGHLDALHLHAAQRQLPRRGPPARGRRRRTRAARRAERASAQRPPGNCSRKRRSALISEPHVADAVAEHGHPVQAHPEGVALVLVGVDSRRCGGPSGGPCRRPGSSSSRSACRPDSPRRRTPGS